MSYSLRSAASGPKFEGQNDGDTLIWDATAKAWTVGAGGGGGAVSSVFGRDGAVVATSGDYNSDQVDNVSNVPGATVSEALETLSVALFSNVRFVDPTNAAAFSTIQQAIDSVSPAEATAGVEIVCRSFTTYTENLTLSSGNWKLSGAMGFASRVSTTVGVALGGPELVGNITWTTGAGRTHGLMVSDFRITGNIGTTVAEAATLRLLRVDLTGNILNSGPGWLNLWARSELPFSNAGQQRLVGSIDVTAGGGGYFVCENYIVAGPVAGYGPAFFNCTLTTGTTSITSNSAFINLRNCVQAINAISYAFTSPGGLVLSDSFSAQTVIQRGGTFTNGSLWMNTGAIGRRSTLANNLPASDIFPFAPPAGLYRCDWSIYITSAGVSGNVDLNLLYTGPGGATSELLGTRAVTSTGHTSGVCVFRSTGVANVQRSVSGITDATGLSYELDVNVQNINTTL